MTHFSLTRRRRTRPAAVLILLCLALGAATLLLAAPSRPQPLATIPTSITQVAPERITPATPVPVAPVPVAPVPATPVPVTPVPVAPVAPTRLLLGITEDNAVLLTEPSVPSVAPPTFVAAQAQFSALHPRLIRLLVNWAAIQPLATVAPALSGPNGGCLRIVLPCAPYAGLAGELAAIAGRQHAGENVQPVIDIYGTPLWAALPVAGCASRGDAFSEPISTVGLAGYRTLVTDILATGRAAGVALPYLAPWNEPNSAAFITPQLSSCGAGAPSRAAAVYAELARTMQSVLVADGAPHQMLLGELMEAPHTNPQVTSIAEFVANTPEDVLCSSDIWTVHDYATWGTSVGTSTSTGASEGVVTSAGFSPVTALEEALDARGGCAARARIWVTETGAGGPRPGWPRSGGSAGARLACQALAAKLVSYLADPRVDAVFQYTFREDPLFPVGLSNVGLTALYPTYALWLAWSQRPSTLAPAPLPAACAA